MRPTLYVAMVDDWELRGNGSGNPRQMQFAPMRELVRIYGEEGILSTFMVEVMQQLTFRKFQDQHPELRQLADEWDEIVLETYSKGHDFQLPIHSQWYGARFENGGWVLPGHWQITRYDESTPREMLVACKDYLQSLLRRINPEYRCVAYRAGAWCLAPSEYMIRLLSEIGIDLDISMAAGLRFRTRHVELDYTKCEESFLPFFPAVSDARRVADNSAPLVCVPTNQFTAGIFNTMRWRVRNKILRRVRARHIPTSSNHAKPADKATHRLGDWDDICRQNLRGRVVDTIRRFCNTHFISDIAQLDYALLTQMMQKNRARARRAGISDMPLVLENHSKDIHNFDDIARFAYDIARADDIKTVTLSEISVLLRSGKLAIRSQAGFCYISKAKLA